MTMNVLLNSRKKMAVSMAFVALLAGSALVTAASAALSQRAYAQGDDSVGFVANAEMIKAHLSQAIANKLKNPELAKAHAGHPIAEHYAMLEPDLAKRDAKLNDQIKAALEGVFANVGTMSPREFRTEAHKIGRMLDAAVAEVVPKETRMDVKFRAQVLNELLRGVEEEYKEAVSGGKIQAMVEYQDAQGFTARAYAVFRSIAASIPEHERDKARELMGEMRQSIRDVREPEAVETLVDGAIKEVSEGAGLEAAQEAALATPAQYIDNIKKLLAQVQQEYGEGNTVQADKLAVEAYLDNFEHVEDPLKKAGKAQLMGEIEQLLREELRAKIRAKVPQGELDAHVAKILEKLGEAEKALS